MKIYERMLQILHACLVQCNRLDFSLFFVLNAGSFAYQTCQSYLFRKKCDSKRYLLFYYSNKAYTADTPCSAL